VKINLITALSSHQVEDQVIEVLLKHDFQLQKRLLSPSDFDSKLIASTTSLRILIISDKDFGLDWREIRRESDENLSILILDVDKRFSSDEILHQANQALRGSNEFSQLETRSVEILGFYSLALKALPEFQLLR